MKKGILSGLCAVGFILLMANARSQKQAIEWTEAYIRENVAFTNISGRAVSADKFVYEIEVADFKKTVPMPPGFGLNGIVFADNGLGNDLVKGDGIYTSDDLFQMTAERSSLIQKNYSVYDEAFLFEQNLKEAGSETEVSGPGIKCKIRKCGCPCRNGYSCRACEWWGWQCLQLYDCEVSLSL